MSSTKDERYEKYRQAYIKQCLKSLEKLNGYEEDAAFDFVVKRLNEDDSNLDDVMGELKARMRLDERESNKYADPSPMNGPALRLKPRDLHADGRQMFEKLKRKGMVKNG